MKDLNKELLEKLKKLCAISLDAKEEEPMLNYLQKTLAHFKNIETIDTTKVSPLISPFSPELSLREDKAAPLCDPETYLEQAPDKQSNFFKVPPVV